MAGIEPTCRVCGVSIELREGRGRRRIFCSPACGRVARGPSSRPRPKKITGTCEVCGSAFLTRNSLTRTCGASCGVALAHRLRSETLKKRRERNCKHCGGVFMKRSISGSAAKAGRAEGIYCSPKCRDDAQRKFSSSKEAQLSHKHARRARLVSAFVERVDALVVFRRDDWVCHLCGEKTIPSLRGRVHPKAPQLDHIVPIVAGGAHSYKNTACACLQCNLSKGSKLVPSGAFRQPALASVE
jgi:hypothetical protein